MKKRGNPGDYIIYHKEDDTTFPMRIAFLKAGGKSGLSVIQKLKVRKSSDGFSFQSSNPTWYNSMSDLALNTTDENSKRLLHPFLGYVSAPATPDAMAASDDEGEYTTIDQKDICIPPPPPLHFKPIDNSFNRQTSTISTNNTFPTHRGEPEKGTVERKEQTTSRKPMTPIPSVDSDKSQRASNDDLFTEETKNETNQNDLDILGNNAPTNLSIRYNLEKKEIQKQLKGHPEGTYIIHQSRDRNEIAKPYTIYANKTSARDGQIRLAPAYIVFHETTGQFSVGQGGKKYSTLQALLTGNKKLLKSQLT